MKLNKITFVKIYIIIYWNVRMTRDSTRIHLNTTGLCKFFVGMIYPAQRHKRRDCAKIPRNLCFVPLCKSCTAS